MTRSARARARVGMTKSQSLDELRHEAGLDHSALHVEG